MREVGGGSGARSIKCFGFWCFDFFFSSVKSFFFGFPYIPPPVSSSCSPISFFSLYLSIRPISLALSASASKCLEYASLCYTLPYWTQNDAHLYFSKRRRLRLDALYHHYHHHHPFPQSNCYSIDVSIYHPFHVSITAHPDVCLFCAMLRLRITTVMYRCSTECLLYIVMNLCDCLKFEWVAPWWMVWALVVHRIQIRHMIPL